MIPAAFDYRAAATLDEAVQILTEHGDDAKILAGGHSLLPLMRLRLAAPALIVDVGTVPNLAYIRDEQDHVAIGALTTHYQMQSNSLLQQRVPLLAQSAGLVGDMQVRNRGTIGGSLAHADPASDLPAVVVVLHAEIVAVGPSGTRIISADDFFQDIWTSALEPVEVVTEVRIPIGNVARGQWYEKFRQRAADWAIVGVAVSITQEHDIVREASIVLTNVGTIPHRAGDVEAALVGSPISLDVVKSAAARAADGIHPSPELKASPEYKQHLARVLTERALLRALALQ